MRIHFLGGVDAVTGSMLLLEFNGSRVLRDCGLFQGRREESRAINSQPPIHPLRLDAVVLSHAHIDHCGNLPTLSHHGFQNPIHCTTATAALTEIMLRDSAHIQEQDANYLNQKTNRQGMEPITPLYTVTDAEEAIKLFAGHHYRKPFSPAAGMDVEFMDAGHILGAAITVFTIREGSRETRVAVAVDLGRRNLPLIRDPEIPHNIDLLVIESTYGDRLHAPAKDAREQLRAVVARTWARGGKVIIPSFALERAQEIIYHLSSLSEEGLLPPIPVFVDSPMATAVSDVFEKSRDYLDEDFAQLRAKIGSVMHPPWLTYVSSVDDSKNISSSDKPCIVISASGMCEHGRILHHLKHGIDNPANSVVIVGFQAQNTLGRRLVEKEKKVKVFGDWFDVRAEIDVLTAFSSHADRNELLEFIHQTNPRQTFLVHGEPHQREALAVLLRENKIDNVFMPARGDFIDL